MVKKINPTDNDPSKPRIISNAQLGTCHHCGGVMVVSPDAIFCFYCGEFYPKLKLTAEGKKLKREKNKIANGPVTRKKRTKLGKGDPPNEGSERAQAT